MDLLFDRTPTLKDHAVSLGLYSDFIFVAPIWASKIASPLKAFMVKEKQHIKRYSFISLCGGSKGQLERIKEQLLQILQREPTTIKELWINDLLVSERKNTIKYTSGYRVLPADLENFKEKIDEFVKVQSSQSNVRNYELR